MKRHIQTLRQIRLPPQRNLIREALDSKMRSKVVASFVEIHQQLGLLSAK